MKVMAITPKRNDWNGEFPYYYDAGEKVELEEGSEYQVAKVEIGAYESSVWIKLPDQSEVWVHGSLKYELVLERCAGFAERRVPFSIVGDLMKEKGLDSPENYRRCYYDDDMPSVKVDYFIFWD